MAQEAYTNADTSKCEYIDKETRARLDLADTMKSHFEENNPVDECGVYTDLMGAALSEVNWDEIAEHLIDAVLDNVTS